MKSIAFLPLLVLFIACQSTGGKNRGRGGDKGEPERPDAQALARETLVRARRARLVLSERWREDASLTAAHVAGEGAEQEAQGNVVFLLSGLRLEIAGSLKITWMPDHDEVLVYASDVELFRQQRKDRPYSSKNLSAVTMANDQVSFFQQ